MAGVHRDHRPGALRSRGRRGRVRTRGARFRIACPRAGGDCHGRRSRPRAIGPGPALRLPRRVPRRRATGERHRDRHWVRRDTRRGAARAGGRRCDPRQRRPQRPRDRRRLARPPSARRDAAPPRPIRDRRTSLAPAQPRQPREPCRRSGTGRRARPRVRAAGRHPFEQLDRRLALVAFDDAWQHGSEMRSADAVAAACAMAASSSAQ